MALLGGAYGVAGSGSLSIGQGVFAAPPGGFLYTDGSSNLFADNKATRDSVTHETHISAQQGNGLFDINIIPGFFGGVKFAGTQLSNSFTNELAITGVGDLTFFSGPQVSLLDAVFGNTYQYFAQASSSGFSFQWHDNSNHGPEINADPSEIRLMYNSTFGNTSGFATGGGYAEWFVGNNFYFLPNSAPLDGDIIYVASHSGSNFHLGWTANGAANPGGANKDVQFNDGGAAFGGSGQFQWDKNFLALTVGDPLGAANKNYFSFSDAGEFGKFANNEGTYFLANYSNGQYILGPNFSGGTSHQTRISVLDKVNQVLIHGAQVVGMSSIAHGGGALNDLTPSSPSSYTGNNTNLTYTVTITRTNVQRVYFNLTSGSWPGNQGVSGGFAATGNIYGGDGSTYVDIALITGSFAPGDTISGALPPFTGTVTSAASVSDAYDFVNGPDSLLNQFCAITLTGNLQGIGVEFANLTGHTIGENWTWNYGVTYGNLANFDGSMPNGIRAAIGDLSSIGQGTQLEIYDPFRLITGVTDLFYIQNKTNANKKVITCDTSNLSISIGDTLDQIFGTKATINDGFKTFTVSADVGFVVQNVAGNAAFSATPGINTFVVQGDIGNNYTKTKFTTDVNGEVVYATTDGNFQVKDSTGNKFLDVDTSIQTIKIGNLDAGNASILTINDQTKSATLESNGSVITQWDGTNRSFQMLGGVLLNPLTEGADANHNVLESESVINMSPTTAAVVTALPASPINGMCVLVRDSTGLANTHNIIITGSGNTINGSLTYVLNINYGSVILIFDSSSGDWGIF